MNHRYSDLDVEAALCLWEAMLDAKSQSQPAPMAPADNENVAAMRIAWGETGTATMRDHARTLSRYVLAVYDAIKPDSLDGFAYDWEVVPAILATIEWTGNRPMTPKVRDGALETIRILQASEGIEGRFLPGDAAAYVLAA